VPEFDEHAVVAELVMCPLQVVERRLLVDEVWRELKEDAAELARLAQRRQPFDERAEDRGAQPALQDF
jgi:hypothetical protein